MAVCHHGCTMALADSDSTNEIFAWMRLPGLVASLYISPMQGVNIVYAYIYILYIYTYIYIQIITINTCTWTQTPRHPAKRCFYVFTESGYQLQHGVWMAHLHQDSIFDTQLAAWTVPWGDLTATRRTACHGEGRFGVVQLGDTDTN